MKILVDIDGTICDSSEGYPNAKPRYDMIEKINKLFDEGHSITYWTARGGNTGIDWKELTAKQLADWGCKFHRLDTQTKPSYDLLIDDKTKRIEEI
jgi:phosphoglycolate phosphatase-like HAD superfamily hydrolase